MTAERDAVATDGPPGALSPDVVFSLLSSARRRYVLEHLGRRDETVRVRDLAEHVAARENESDVADLTYRQRKRVYTSLHQTHLPTLDDAGVIEYDAGRGLVSLSDRAAELDVYLSHPPERAWHRYYLALAGGGLTAIVLAWVGLWPFAAVPALVYAGSLAAILGLLAAVHAFETERRRHAGATGGGRDGGQDGAHRRFAPLDDN